MPDRQEFVIKDLAISLTSARVGGAGGTWLPADEDSTPPPWLSPIAAVLTNQTRLEAVNRVITETLATKQDLTGIAAAFDGDPDGNPAIVAAIREIGAAVVASAAYRPIGSTVGYPDPDCGGTSFETIPPTITPVVHTGMEIHRVSELPRMVKQMHVAVDAIDGIAADLAPRGDEVKVVAQHLREALDGLA